MEQLQCNSYVVDKDDYSINLNFHFQLLADQLNSLMLTEEKTSLVVTPQEPINLVCLSLSDKFCEDIKDIELRETRLSWKSTLTSSSTSYFTLKEGRSSDPQLCISENTPHIVALLQLIKMALDLRKKVEPLKGDDEDNNDLKTTSVTKLSDGSGCQILPNISHSGSNRSNVSISNSICPDSSNNIGVDDKVTANNTAVHSHLSTEETSLIQKALKRLIRLLRLQSLQTSTREAIRQLLSLLYLYMKKGGLEMFDKTFNNDRSIKEFVLLLCRVSQSPSQPRVATNDLQPVNFAQLVDDGPQLIERSPNQTRSTSQYRTQPYPLQHGSNLVSPPRVQQQQHRLPQSERSFLHQPLNMIRLSQTTSYSSQLNWHQLQSHHAAASTSASVTAETSFKIQELAYDQMGDFPPEVISFFLQLVQEMPGLPLLASAVEDCFLKDLHGSAQTEKLVEPKQSNSEPLKDDNESDSRTALPSPSSVSSSSGGGRTPVHPSSPPDLIPISPMLSPSQSVPYRSFPSTRVGDRSPNWVLSPLLSLSQNPGSTYSPSPQSNGANPNPCSPLPRQVENRMNSISLDSSTCSGSMVSPPQAILCRSGPITAREEILGYLDPVIKERSMRQVAMSKIEVLTEADCDGDTPLMVACANPKINLAELYSLIERLKNAPNPEEIFNAVNQENKSALYLAASENRPLVAGFLAETMSTLGVRMMQTDHKTGNTLIHSLVMWGDEFARVLEYLLRVKLPNGRCAFDLDARNHEGRSALHEAVTRHRPNDTNCSFTSIIRLLVSHGANAGLSDGTSGKTPVHITVEKRDPALLKILLKACPSAANATMYNDNRPLHSAATLSGVTEQQQLDLVKVLLEFGADKAARNKANKLPVELVKQGREKVKGVLQARARPLQNPSV